MKNRYSAFILIIVLIVMVSAVAFAAPPWPHNTFGCSMCHNALVATGKTSYNNICVACHSKSVDTPFTQADVASRGGSVLSRYSGGIAPAKIYQTSHGWTGTSINDSVGSQSATTGPLSLNANIKGKLSCQTCHNVHSAKSGFKDAYGSIPITVGEPGYGKFLRNTPNDMCVDCHRSRNNTSHEIGSHPVNISISSAKIRANTVKFEVVETPPSSGRYYLNPINSNPGNSTSAMSIVNGKLLCTSCHSTHYADSNSSTVDGGAAAYGSLSASTGSLLKTSMFGGTAFDRNICTNCHKPTAHSTMGTAQCADCHSGHVEYDPNPTTAAEREPNAFVLRRYVNMSAGVRLPPLVPGKLGEVTAYRQKVVYLPVSSAALTVSANAQMIGTCVTCHTKPAATTAVPEHGYTDPNICATCHNTTAGLGAGQNNLVCGGCHGMPPVRNLWGTYSSQIAGYAVYSSVRSPNRSRTAITRSYKDSTGALFKSEYSSAHKRHSNGQNLPDTSSYAYSCAECHFNTSLSNRYMVANHKNQGYVDVFKEVSSSIAITAPQSGAGATRPKYVATGAGACTAVFCHSNGNPRFRGYSSWSVKWGGLKPNAKNLGCNSCHRYGDKLTTNAHAKHVKSNTYNLKCATCHNLTTLFANNTTIVKTKNGPKTVTPHVNGAKDLSFNSGTPGRATTWTQSNAQCSTSYCHSNGKGTLYDTLTWNSTLDAVCTGCHGGNVASATPITTGAHGKHVNNNGRNFTCGKCHGKTVGLANDRVITNYSKHINEAPFGDYSAPGFGKNCNASYCHSNGASADGLKYINPEPVWTDSLTCSGCHGNYNQVPSAFGQPNYPNVSTAQRGQYNSHSIAHVGASTDCNTCHARTVTVLGNAILGSNTTHVNMKREIVFKPAVTGTYDKFAKTCNISCHAGVRRWGGASSGSDCSGCHGGDLLSLNPIVSANHTKHLTSDFSCTYCHVTVVPTADNRSRNNANHDLEPNDRGRVAFKRLAYTNYSGAYTFGGSASTGSCAATYCHNNVTITWNSTATAIACNACHAAANSGHWATNSAHRIHDASATLLPGNFTNLSGNVSSASEYRFACSACHDPGSTKANHVNGPIGVNRTADIYFGFTTAGTRPIYAEGAAVIGTDGILKWTAGHATNNNCNASYCHTNGQAGAGKLSGANVLWSTTTSTSCTVCHGGPANSNLLSGKHQAHLDTASNTTLGTAYTCKDCHANTVSSNGVVSNKKRHVNKLRDYSGPRAYRTGYNPTTKSCSTYCHSNGKPGNAAILSPANPTWTDAAFTTCNKCHGLNADFDSTANGAPNYVNVSSAQRNQYNSHKTHVITKSFSCYVCHARTTNAAGTAIFTGTSSHTNKRRDVDFDLTGLPGATATYNKNAQTCSSLSGANCHSGSAFRWGGIGGCTTCHAFDNIATGNHTKHLVSLLCADCHSKTVDNGGALLAVNRHKERNPEGLVSMKRPSTFTNFSGIYNYTSNNCSATYCHGAGTPTWGDPALACNSCHAADNSGHWSTNSAHKLHIENTAQPKNFTNNSGNVSTAGAYRFSCSACHEMGAGKSIHSDGPKSALRAADVFFGFTTAGVRGSYSQGVAVGGTDGSLNWSNGTTGCNTTYCHSNGRPFGSGNAAGSAVNWSTSTTTIGCTACHGAARGTSTAIATGAHRAHMNNITTLGASLATVFTCNACHANTVSSNNVVSNKKRHVNKYREYSGVKAGRMGTFAGQATCGNLYCHSNGNPNALVFINMTGSKRWLSGGTLGCNGCHGRSSAVGAPDYANAGGNYLNSHALHISKLNITSTKDCSFCHRKSVDPINGGRLNAYSSAHLNGGANVWMPVQFGANTTYAGNTCSNVTCHSDGKGQFVNPVWGQATNCAYCHKINKLSKGHIYHVYTTALPVMYNYTANNSTTVRYNYGCAVCHPVANGNHMINGIVMLNFNPAEAGTGALKKKNKAIITSGNVQAGSAASGTTTTSVPGTSVRCINLYCHSNGMVGASFRAYTTPDWYGGLFTGDKCANCHGNSPNTTRADGRLMAGSPAHYNTNWLGTGTAGGHAMGIHARKITKGGSTFVGLMASGTTAPSAHGLAGGVTPTTINCNTCHNTVVTTAANDQSILCVSCHSGTPKGNAAIANKSKHADGAVAVVYDPSFVTTRAQIKSATFTDFSATQTNNFWHRNNGYKADSSYDRSHKTLAAGATAYNPGTGTCANVVCHFNASVNWTNTSGAVTCFNCHSKL